MRVRKIKRGERFNKKNKAVTKKVKRFRKRMKGFNIEKNKIDGKIKFAIVLTALCIVMMLGISIFNKVSSEKMVGLGAAEYPRISFNVDGKNVNHLSAYVEDMDIAAMRDTITPIPSDGMIQMNIEDSELEIEEITYRVFSLDGETKYVDNYCDPEGSLELNLGAAFREGKNELALQVILQTDKQEYSYYTRIEKEEGLEISKCLNFAEEFHTMTFDLKNEEALETFLEPNEKSDNTTYQKVNIHSNVYHICWGNLKPEISTAVEWSIKESSVSYTSLLAKYQVKCQNEEGVQETYNIREFFRVRLNEDEMYLLNYDRTMNQIFDPDSDILTEYSLMLGIADSELEYETNKKGTIVAFIQERELWIYNKSKNKIIQVFSFGDDENADMRNLNDEHNLRIISMDDKGNLIFSVSGYMNRGVHEGQAGVSVYSYSISENAVEEKAFIQSNKSFAIADDELGKMIYYNQEQKMLYILTGGTFYQINMESEKQTVLAEGLDDDQYAISEDGHLLAYQLNGDVNTASEVQVMDLSSGETYVAKAADNEAIKPLGFITGDFICGYVRAEDVGTSVTGEELLPMYKMEILEMGNKVAKTYAPENIYISDVWVDENQITLNRMTKENSVYTGTTRDYITNTEETRNRAILLDTFSTDLKEKQNRFVFEEKIEKQEPKVIVSNMQIKKKILTVAFDSEVKKDQYYVYGLGKLQGIYDNAAQSILEAEEISGVVISSEQEYIWESGNRDLGYSIECEPFTKAEGQTSLSACMEYMEKYEAERMDLTGCSLSQVMYVVNRGFPVITLIDKDHAVLITGYNWIDLYYIDPDTGEECAMPQREFEEMAEKAGNTFIGYK
ncbi:MAG: hypothetical protein U0L05_03560 [Schaedlerella sp.]|nr:hypothetical protein [Schaedlerella sp.]